MKSILLSIAVVGLLSAQAQTLKVTNEKDKQLALQNLNNKYPAYAAIAKQIWANAELGFQETKSSTLLQETLRKEGFNVQAGVSEMPTAFVVTYG